MYLQFLAISLEKAGKSGEEVSKLIDKSVEKHID